MTHVPTANEVETFTGRFVDTKRPDASTICIEDIAHALANTGRFGGHCLRFYSVAEHAVFVSKRLQRRGHGPLRQIGGLHHDDAEAYLGDIPRPLKPLLGRSYELLTERMDRAIATALGIHAGVFHDDEVKSADSWALLVEARYLLPSQGRHWFVGEQGAHAWGLDDQPSRIVTPDYWYGGLIPDEAEKLYLARHNELMEG